jgi:hypothetical protein
MTDIVALDAAIKRLRTTFETRLADRLSQEKSAVEHVGKIEETSYNGADSGYAEPPQSELIGAEGPAREQSEPVKVNRIKKLLAALWFK